MSRLPRFGPVSSRGLEIAAILGAVIHAPGRRRPLNESCRHAS